MVGSYYTSGPEKVIAYLLRISENLIYWCIYGHLMLGSLLVLFLHALLWLSCVGLEQDVGDNLNWSWQSMLRNGASTTERRRLLDTMNELLFPNRTDTVHGIPRRMTAEDPAFHTLSLKSGEEVTSKTKVMETKVVPSSINKKHKKTTSTSMSTSEANTENSLIAYPGKDAKRELYGTYTTTVPCVICSNMQYCDALNGLQVQEVYLPDNLNELGTCVVLDKLGENVYNEVFGNSKTFRDTPQCRDIVMQYLCLFYGSENDMYTNFCVYQEDVTDSNPVNHRIAPRPPCRSFCVQVAEVCANDPLFIQICNNIACPPMEDECTPDPKIDGQVLAANIGCDMPYSVNPYFKASDGYRVGASGSLALVGSAFMTMMALWFM